jgi:hypothetical protein
MTVRLGDAVAFAQIGVVGLDGRIELEGLRLYGLPEAAPALLCGGPTSARGGQVGPPRQPRSGQGSAGTQEAVALPMAIGRAWAEDEDGTRISTPSSSARPSRAAPEDAVQA